MRILERLARWPRFLAKDQADPGTMYDMLGERAMQPGGEVPVVNMGYWPGIGTDEPQAIERAVYALFDRVAEGARLEAGMHVLDAGCGFGTNGLHLLEKHGAGKVTGLNVSAVQLETAARRTQAAGMEQRVEWILGSVTKMPVADASVDRVVSVEAAFHFDTRDHFFAEAFRVLRPGGVLSMVDLVASPPRHVLDSTLLASIRRTQSIPLANVYDRAEYVRRVQAAGFEVEEEESIVDRVFPQFRRWQMTRPPSLLFAYDLIHSLASLPYMLYAWDYIRLVARKPVLS
jgi:cyclopropane fatty-acyl-phospholipid synthase-like methyltransferase